MIPFLETGVNFVATKGFDLVAAGSKSINREALPATPQGQALDATLAAAALVPAMINVFGPSTLLERFHSLTPQTLYKLYKARPYLDAATVAAIGLMGLRGRAARGNDAFFKNTTRVVAALRFGANLISPPSAYAAQQSGHLVITTRELNKLLKPDDRVLGLVINGEARCYPLEILRKPHFLHDTVGGVAVAPTYCERSGAAIAFRDEWEGQRLDLNVAGYSNNNVVFYEKHADAAIQQIEAQLVAGPHAGDPLQVFPLVQTTWRAWRELHPDTTGVWYEQPLQANVVQQVLGTIEQKQERQTRPTHAMRGPIDDRLPPMTEVLGLVNRHQAMAILRQELRREPVREFTLGGEPFVVFYDPRRDVAMCFSRRQGDRVLSFKEAAHGKGVAEDQDGRLWSLTGELVEDAETRLAPLAMTVDQVRWYVWSHFYPASKLVGQARQATPAS